MYATYNYGIVKKDHAYSILAEGFDWYLVRIRGQAMYAPKWVFEDD